MEVPVKMKRCQQDKFVGIHTNHSGDAYGALKLRSLSPAAFENVVEADFSTGKLLALRLARASHRTVSAIAAVTIHRITVDVVKAAMRT